MSSIYTLEPSTQGKVILKTTLGPIEIELWAKEAPRTVRNFVQHLLEGYYTNCPFHRLVRDFVLQGGDPTGTGDGGVSVYDGGKPFPGEMHSRLRFTHRGIVAMAGSDRDDNRSQFFITLTRCEELNNKHTIFGKVVGDTIFNVLAANKLTLVEGTEEPTNPPKILGYEIVEMPFDDIVPRPLEQRPIYLLEKERREAAKKDDRSDLAKKDKNVLSFGQDESDDDDDDGNMSTRISLKRAALLKRPSKLSNVDPKQEQPKQPEVVEQPKEEETPLPQQVSVEKDKKKKTEKSSVDELLPGEKQKKRRRTEEEEDALLARMEKFRRALRSAPAEEKDKDTSGEDDRDWMKHSLVFKKMTDEEALAVAGDDLMVEDPLLSKKKTESRDRDGEKSRRSSSSRTTTTTKREERAHSPRRSHSHEHSHDSHHDHHHHHQRHHHDHGGRHH